jgi:aminoglycoside/choline kinase family phosphotransferase
MDVEADEYTLLLEDLAPARVGDQLLGCSPEEAELAVRELAKFHAAWWDSARLAEIDWMPLANDPANKAAEESYQEAWGPFLKRFGERLPPGLREVGERLATKINIIQDETAEPPRTITHGDYRYDNLFFATPEGGDPLAVIDWQIAFRGRGTYDVAYLMSQSLRPEGRRANEMEVLRAYHRILTENGVRGYDFAQCLHDYRLATLFCLAYPVIVGGTLDLSNERGVALATAMLDRSVAAIVDLDAGELLPK